MIALVTGGSGFLGGRLATVLAERGEKVFVLARPTSNLRHLTHSSIEIAQGDLTDQGSLERAVSGVTHIFHCAACSTDWASWESYYSANVTGTKNLLAAAQKAAGLKRFVHVSTTDVYGYPAVPCDESGPTRDAGHAFPYNRTKRMGELAVWRAFMNALLPVTVVRPATIYGPRGKDFTVEIAKLLRLRMMATIDHGSARGGFIHVDSVVDAMIAAASFEAALGEAFNLTDETGADWQRYLRLFSKALGCPMPWLNFSAERADGLAKSLERVYRMLRIRSRPLLTQHAVRLLGWDQEFPAHKARQVLGFAPKFSLEEGIDRSVAWLRQRRRS